MPDHQYSTPACCAGIIIWPWNHLQHSFKKAYMQAAFTQHSTNWVEPFLFKGMISTMDIIYNVIKKTQQFPNVPTGIIDFCSGSGLTHAAGTDSRAMCCNKRLQRKGLANNHFSIMGNSPSSSFNIPFIFIFLICSVSLQETVWKTRSEKVSTPCSNAYSSNP